MMQTFGIVGFPSVAYRLVRDVFPGAPRLSKPWGFQICQLHRFTILWLQADQAIGFQPDPILLAALRFRVRLLLAVLGTIMIVIAALGSGVR